MAKYYQDFVGLNTFMYEPGSYDREDQTFVVGAPFSSVALRDLELIGFEGSLTNLVFLGSQNSLGAVSVNGQAQQPISVFKNDDFFTELPNTASFFNALLVKRNGPYGYPMWKQIRVSDNPLSRAQRKRNIFTIVTEPGQTREMTIGGQTNQVTDRFGEIRVFNESPINASHKPLELYGGVSVYDQANDKDIVHSVRLKTSFGNQLMFFANDEIDRMNDLVFETDENYENFKKLYLKGALGSDSSPLERFQFLTYKQQVWPKQEFAYLNKTRTRTYFENRFWRDARTDRTRPLNNSGLNDHPPDFVDGGFGLTVPSQSMWPLDAAADFGTRSRPDSVTIPGNLRGRDYYVGGFSGSQGQGGFNTGNDTTGSGNPLNPSLGGAGVLMNSYSQVVRGTYDVGVTARTPEVDVQTGVNAILSAQALTASCYYARRHTLNNIKSVVSPSGMRIVETASAATNNGTAIGTSSLFEGPAAWDAPRQAGKNPFYDSYRDYAAEIRLKGQGYSIVPEFRISSHVETYQTKGVTEELKAIFELSGALRRMSDDTFSVFAGFSISGSRNTTTETSSEFFKVLSNSEFLKHFDVIKKDHEDFAEPISLSLRCKAVKKFLPYEGFYPAQRTVEMAEQFHRSYSDDFKTFVAGALKTDTNNFAKQGILEPLFAPGILFNTIKSGIACDYPVIFPDDIDRTVHIAKTDYQGQEGRRQLNYSITGSKVVTDKDSLFSAFSARIPFEALVEPEKHLANRELEPMGPHPFELGDFALETEWGGAGDKLYTKMANNFLAETIDFFMRDSQMTTLSSLPSESPKFGNAEKGKIYAMRLKMRRSRNQPNDFLVGIGQEKVTPPQDLYPRFDVYENFTMYSRPTAFGPPTYGGLSAGPRNTPLGSVTYSASGSFTQGTNIFIVSGSDSQWGYNFPYTPPYYYGEAWCDIVFQPSESRKYTVDEIIASSSEFPYYTRFWWNGINDALRDVTGISGSDANAGKYTNPLLGRSVQITPGGLGTAKYEGYDSSPWMELIRLSLSGAYEASDRSLQTFITSSGGTAEGLPYSENNWGMGVPIGTNYPLRLKWAKPPSNYFIQHPFYLNYNAMQLDSSINIFGKAIVESTDSKIKPGTTVNARTDATNTRETRWVIQPKFETPMLNFNSYTNLTDDPNLTCPTFASESVPRGMWHQYGIDEEDPQKGVFLEIVDIPTSWFKGALGVQPGFKNKYVDSLADLCGFSTEPVKLGQVAQSKEVSEAVVAVPFFQVDGTRKFFSLPKSDIERAKEAIKTETVPGVVDARQHGTGQSVIDMVRKMQKFVMPPSMDFVKYSDIDPFAMYIFDFKHVFSKKDLADMWQNLPPGIGRSFEESEAVISHPLLAKELLGGGAVIKDDLFDASAKGPEFNTDIQWMIFKAKQKAKTNYFDKVVTKKGTTSDTSEVTLEGVTTATIGTDPTITYNWPYDFFSLIELVKLDAEVSLGNFPKAAKPEILEDMTVPLPKATRQRLVVEAAKPTSISENESRINDLLGSLTNNSSGGNNSGGGSGGPGFSGGGGINNL